MLIIELHDFAVSSWRRICFASLIKPQVQRTMTAKIILQCRPSSHPFTEREIPLAAPIKIGRAVANCKPGNDNGYFNCKVLSRNHALLWYENGKVGVFDPRNCRHRVRRVRSSHLFSRAVVFVIIVEIWRVLVLLRITDWHESSSTGN